ncbi:MAG TPA: MarR family winged helix-turn-helix transcriptional regulator [Gammaproteobacteria bacterium]
MTERTPPRPFGYWLKRVDEALTAAIDRAQAAHGLSRIEWQVLESLARSGGMPRRKLGELLSPFADPGRFHELVGELARRGLVESTDEGRGLCLSAEGKRRHQAALETQRALRLRAFEGVSEAEYTTTMKVLQRVAENLSGEETPDDGAPRSPPR